MADSATHDLPPNSDADARLAAALAEYQSAAESGTPPDRAAFFARFPDLAERLANCLDAMAAVHAAVTPLPRPSEAPTAASLRPGSTVGHFRIVREIGRGGMGVVYEAVQETLGRRVALKVLPFAAAADGRAVQRFRHEAQAAGALRHPHIVPVYAVGTAGHVHYYAMQLIDGRSLSAARQGPTDRTSAPDTTGTRHETPAEPPRANTPDPTPEAVPARSVTVADEFRTSARLVAVAADALHHAHECGIVHRDVKPGNLLIDAKGHLWVADFGLAKLPGSDLTGTADVMGTVRYMSPEQASGRAAGIDGRSDVYSLGVTLYELLTGVPAFEADDRRALLRKVLEDEPIPPRKRDRRVPADLETVCLKAMAKDPAERYQTAAAFRDDLERFLADRPVEAKPPTLAQRGGKWVKRNRVLVGVTGSVVLASLLAFTGLLVAGNAALDRRRRDAEDALARESVALAAEAEAKGRIAGHLAAEQQARIDERGMAYRHTVALAYREYLASQFLRAERLLNECPPERRRWEWHYLERLVRSEANTLPVDPTAEVKGLGIAPDGDILVIDAKGWGRTSIRDGFRRGPGDGAAHTMWLFAALSPDGRTAAHHRASRLAPGDRPEFVTVEMATGATQVRFGGTADGTTSVRYSPDGRRLVSWGGRATFTVWEAATGAKVATLGHGAPIRNVTFHPAGKWLASYGTDATIRLWDIDRGREIRVIRDDGLRVPPENSGTASGELDFSPDGREVAVAPRNGTVRIWDIETGDLRLVFPAHAHKRGATSVKYSPDGRWLVTAGLGEGAVRLWDARTGNAIDVLHGHESLPSFLHFDPSGRSLVTGRARSTECRYWDLTTQATARPLGHQVRTQSTALVGVLYGDLAYDRTGRRLVVTASRGCTVWEPDTGNEVGSFNLGSKLALAVAFAPDGQGVTLVAPSGGLSWNPGIGSPTASFPYQSVPRRDITTGAPAPKATGIQVYPGQVAFSGDGTRFAAIDSASAVSLHDATGAVVRTFHRPGDLPAYFLAMDRDGARVAAVGTDGVLTAWDGATGTALWRSDPLGGKVVALAFDPSARRLAYGLADGRIGLLGADGRPLHAIQGTGAPALSLAFSPDGDRLVSGHGASLDPHVGVRVWDSETGQELISIPLPSPAVGLAFRPDGRTLAALGLDGRVWLLDGGTPSAADREESRRRRWAAWHETQAVDAEVAAQWWAARWHVDRMLAAKPGDAALRARRAALLVRSNESDRLTPAEAASLADTVPLDNLEPVFRLAARLIDAGEAAAYRRLCARLLSSLTPKTQPLHAELVYRLAALAPGGVADPKALAAQCREPLKAHGAFTRHFVTGAILYRAGEYEAALAELLAGEKLEPGSASHALVWLYSAMACHKLERPDDARRWLARADEWHARNSAAPPSGAMPVEFPIAVSVPVLRKEVTALLGLK